MARSGDRCLSRAGGLLTDGLLPAPPARAGCNKCFRVSENLGGNTVFKCQWTDCGHTVPRDLNGAAGIFARRVALTADPALREVTNATTTRPAWLPAASL